MPTDSTVRAARPATPADGLAWVTGASSGLGRAVALELARRGWTVVATARRRAELEEMALGRNDRIFVAEGDVTDRAGMAALVAQIVDRHGPIARAVLNAGAYFVDAERSLDPDAVWRTFEVNVGGVVNCAAPVVAAMAARGRGQVSITSSVAGYGPLPRSMGYGPTKAALINLAGALRLTYAGQGVHVQVVCPGFVKTPLTDKNPFPMPFLVPVDQAAQRLCDGLDGGAFEIAFPRRFAWLLKALNLLPWAAYLPLVARATR